MRKHNWMQRLLGGHDGAGTCRGLRKPVFNAAALLIVLSAAVPALSAVGPAFFPTPMQAEWGGMKRVERTYSLRAAENVPFATVREYRMRLAEWGFKDDSGAGVDFSLDKIPLSECEAVAEARHPVRTFIDNPALQAYFLETDGGDVDIKACGEDGFFYALMTFGKMTSRNGQETFLYDADITDYPAFPVRGIFEGAYGVWHLEGRLEVIDWMGEVKLNSFLYGPKGDPKIRRRWREPYDDVELFEFKRMIERAERNHIQFSYTIAPTLGFEYGSDEDFEILLSRVRQMQGLGVRSFILAFDDTMAMMYDPDDREKFSNLGEAEAFVANRLLDAMREYDPDSVLVLVPEIYAGVYEMDYTRALAGKLKEDVYIGWTGSEIGAPRIGGESLKKFVDFYGKVPSLGDNWGSLYPLVARLPETQEYTHQFTMNPYNLFGEMPVPGLGGASEPVLAPIECSAVAQFGWNPDDYSPDSSLDRLAEVYFTEEARPLFKWIMYRDFFEFTSYYVLDTDYATPIERMTEKLISGVMSGEEKISTVKRLREEIQVLIEQPDKIEEECTDPGIGAVLAKRAKDWRPWFELLEETLNNASARLEYWKEGADKTDLEMTLEDGEHGIYSTDLPPAEAGDEIFYTVRMFDDWGNTALELPPDGSWTTLVEDAEDSMIDASVDIRSLAASHTPDGDLRLCAAFGDKPKKALGTDIPAYGILVFRDDVRYDPGQTETEMNQAMMAAYLPYLSVADLVPGSELLSLLDSGAQREKKAEFMKKGNRICFAFPPVEIREDFQLGLKVIGVTLTASLDPFAIKPMDTSKVIMLYPKVNSFVVGEGG